MTPETAWSEYANYYGHDSVEAYQKFFGLLATGLLDPVTVASFEQARCSVRDDLLMEEARREKIDLTYCIESYVDGIEQVAQEAVVADAFASWARVSRPTFKRVANPAQADLLITAGHIDGPGGGVLGWAEVGGRLTKFEKNQNWTVALYRAMVTHEFGHLLGLTHSQMRTALMYAMANPQIWTPQEQDDIPRIVTYYGPPTGAPVPGMPPTPGTPPIPPLSPTGGIMREIVTLVVAAVLGYFKQSFPFLGRFLTDAMQEKIVDFIMRRFGLANVQLVQGSAPVTLASMDIDSVSRELTAEIGPPPTA